MSKAEWLLSEKPQSFKVSNPKATYAVIIIMAGDSNLAPMVALDLKEMSEGFSEDISVLLLINIPSLSGVVVETTSTSFRALDHFHQLSMGDPRAIANFLARALVSYSSYTRFALGFWGHSRGVKGGNDPGEILLPAALLKKLIARRPQRRRRQATGASAQGLLPDATPIDTLTNREARSALAVAFARARRKEPIDMIFSDRCLDGSVEVYTELREFTQTVVASSFPIPGTGWDYRLWLQQTASKRPLNAQDWALIAVQCYGETYPPRMAGESPRQLAAFSTSSDLIRAFGRVVKALMDMEQEPAFLLLQDAISGAMEQRIRFYTTLDLQQLVGQLHDLAEAGLVKEACSSFLVVFSEVQIGITAQPYEDFPLGGLTIWVPVALWHDPEGVGQYYRKLEFVKKTKWLQCLKKLFLEHTHLGSM